MAGPFVNLSGQLQEIARSNLKIDTVQGYIIPASHWRVESDLTLLPTAGDGTSLGRKAGTHGTDTPALESSDSKAATIGETARVLFQLPPEYVDGDDISFVAHAGMKTTVSDGTATLDLSVFKSDGEAGVDGTGERYSGSAVDINSLTLSDHVFTLNGTSLSPGDWLDIKMSVDVTDAATGTAVIGHITETKIRLDIRG